MIRIVRLPGEAEQLKCFNRTCSLPAVDVVRWEYSGWLMPDWEREADYCRGHAVGLERIYGTPKAET